MNTFDRLIGNEGGYSDHRQDPDGEWGVIQRAALAWGYAGPMWNVPP
ncbi:MULTISPECIES: glycosyl hydrolase 108 family protein [Burkholderiaceae]|nr:MULTISPECIES: glycosyl hydrolase 108 family protein [Burkholderiaceae]MCF2134496.1 hypothetical protein [Mycetohabitans sp. B3]MCG1040720.1 hypothetical protein [Mycetohabitans sp. B7]